MRHREFRSARGLDGEATDLRPVLFHHGIGTTRDIWSEWVPPVASRHSVVTFDMRGFGRSPIPPLNHDWSMAELVDDLWDVADAAGVTRVHLVGESMGGTIALAAAIARPERAASVTISNGTFRGAGIGQIAGWQRDFDEGGAAGWSARMMENRFAPGVGDPQGLAWFRAEQDRTPAHVALGLAAVLAQADLTTSLSKLRVPVSLVLPDSSPFVPIDHAAALKAALPHARLRVVPNRRHGLPFSDALAESAHLLAFLSEIEEAWA
jgi:pimeloyl-ACP methyl ester carboxylesterase